MAGFGVRSDSGDRILAAARRRQRQPTRERDEAEDDHDEDECFAFQGHVSPFRRAWKR